MTDNPPTATVEVQSGPRMRVSVVATGIDAEAGTERDTAVAQVVVPEAETGSAPEPASTAFPNPAEGARELPRVVIYPLTPEVERAVAADGLAVTRFPFRVGRHPDNREEAVLAFNDIELGGEKPYRVSLNHFALDLSGPGVVVRDRGSLRGTMVNGKRIGPGQQHDHAPLRSGHNEVVVGPVSSAFGAPQSQYRFRVVVGGE